MIIQCVKCSTKYRFEDSLMEGRGVWVRCSRCGDVFFQENPVKTELKDASAVAADMDALLPGTDSESSLPGLDRRLEVDASREEIDAILAKVEETKKTLEEHHEQEDLVSIEKDIGKSDESSTGVIGAVMKSAGAGEKDEEKIEPETHRSSGKTGKREFWSPWRIIVLILFINLLFGGIYLWFFPGMGERVVRSISSAVSGMSNLFGVGAKTGDFHLNQIQLQDVRQRLVSNVIAGQLRVIEGVAVNSSPWPITRMQVRGELYNSKGVMIADRLAYGGNLLNDEELSTLSEEALQKELDLPMGSDAQNIRIEPKGQIPFMIVFAREPSGVVKTTVSPAGGERLPK